MYLVPCHIVSINTRSGNVYSFVSYHCLSYALCSAHAGYPQSWKILHPTILNVLALFFLECSSSPFSLTHACLSFRTAQPNTPSSDTLLLTTWWMLTLLITPSWGTHPHLLYYSTSHTWNYPLNSPICLYFMFG